ncbi:MAG: hypothetical protein LBQ54_04550 [Planctomycetaceae bacterium]|jgi:nitrogen regulatory protein PII|nr:hypothetical protein [Planctomycetaceae bacterium]
MNFDTGYELIITIVNKGWADHVIKVTRNAGAPGATVLHARGSGIHDITSFLGLAIEPEKEIILNVVPESISEKIVTEVADALNLKAPGTGISMILPLRGVTGLFHDSDSRK